MTITKSPKHKKNLHFTNQDKANSIASIGVISNPNNAAYV